MKTIAYYDRTGGVSTMRQYVSLKQNDLFEREGHTARIERALDDLKHTGNIVICLVRGRKVRRIAVKGM